MSFIDTLIGSAPKTKFTTLPTVTPEQASAYDALLKELGGAASTQYGGQLGAPLSSLETTSLAGLEQAALAAAQPDSAYARGENALAGILGAGPQDFTDYYKKAVEEPFLREFNEQVLPGISRRFAPSGFYSSDRIRQDELAQRNAAEGLGRTYAELAYKARQDDTTNKLAALGLLPQVAGARSSALAGFLQAGAVPREAAALNNQLQYEEFVRQQAQAEDRRKALIAALGIPQFENIAVQKGGSTGVLGGVAQGVGSFLGGYFG